ncbi:unnamed protein product [Camellia sinensis]
MAKKKASKRKKKEKVREIDHIPKFWQQPRSTGGPRRRTDFSLFFCSASSSFSNAPLGKGLLLESSSSTDKLTSVTITGLEETRDKRKDILKLPVAQCSHLQYKRRGLFSNIIEVPVVEVESVGQNALFEANSGRNVDKQTSDMVRKIEFLPDKSQITESSNFCITPGSVVWAKTARQLWWPAEILGESSSVVDSKDQDVDGHVLVQYYGIHESAWVDPARDLSQFDDCFEERSCNPVEEFQDALKQALRQKACQSLGKQFIGSSDDPNCSRQQDQSPDKWNSSSSSRTESDCLERRRGKRERKPKVRFDEVTYPLQSVRKIRRFRIMRFLGLAAPIGSPFLPTHNLMQQLLNVHELSNDKTHILSYKMVFFYASNGLAKWDLGGVLILMVKNLCFE